MTFAEAVNVIFRILVSPIWRIRHFLQSLCVLSNYCQRLKPSFPFLLAGKRHRLDVMTKKRFVPEKVPQDTKENINVLVSVMVGIWYSL